MTFSHGMYVNDKASTVTKTLIVAAGTSTDVTHPLTCVAVLIGNKQGVYFPNAATARIFASQADFDALANCMQQSVKKQAIIILECNEPANADTTYNVNKYTFLCYDLAQKIVGPD